MTIFKPFIALYMFYDRHCYYKTNRSDLRSANREYNKSKENIGTVPKSGKNQHHVPSTNIHDHSHFWLGTGTSIKSGGEM